MMHRARTSGLVSLAVVLAMAATAPANDLRERLAAVTSEKYPSDAVVVLSDIDVTVQPSGIGVTRTREVVKVLREGGVRGQAVRRFEFDPTTNRICVEALRVHRADGGVVEVPLRAAAVQPVPQWGIFWASDQVLIDLPRISPGDAVESVYTKTGFNVAYLADGPGGPLAGAVSYGADLSALEPPMPGHWYDEVEFWSSTPVVEKRYTVRAPRSMPLQYEVYNGELRASVTFEGEDVVYRFEKRDIQPVAPEPSMASTRDTQCKLVLATLEDWPSKSRWFHEKNEPSFETSDEIRAKVREIIAGLHSDEEKITALNHWVAENIRYVGTSRGACEGYTTHHVQETFRDRGGVCKDKAGLLVAMLREAGFESYIVMTQAGTDVAPIPADQFNHAVTCIRNADGTFRLLDPTWMPKSRENWSSAEQLQYVVYGTPEGEPLAISPYSGPEENTAAWRGASDLTASGTLRCQLEFTAVGSPETSLRRSLAGDPPAERVGTLEGWLRTLSPDARLAEHAIMDAADFSGPIRLRAGVEAAGYAFGSDQRRFLRLPMLRRVLGDVVAGDLRNTTSLETRKYPLRLRSTRRIEISETLRLPAGWKARDLPEAVTMDGPAAALKFSVQQSGGTIEYTLVLDVRQRTIPVADYANYRDVVRAFERLCERYVACAPEAKSAQAGAATAGTD